MAWFTHVTPRGTLHVVNSEDGSHFEAASQDEAEENVAAITAAKEEAAKAEEAAQQHTDEVVPPVAGTVGTLRID